MHEYEINVLKEEQARLPLTTNKSPRKAALLTPGKSIVKKTEASKNSATATYTRERFSSPITVIYPSVQEYIDQVVQPPTETVDPGSKRKRPRRVYVAEFARCASLRSRQAAPVEAPQITPPTETQASPTPTESTEEYKYIKLEHFKPCYWNIIEEEPETKSSGKKRRAANRKRRNRLEPEATYSPETAAAIAAAQLELESSKPIGRGFRKRKQHQQQQQQQSSNANSNNNNNNNNMSLYDRRYQNAQDEPRRGGVANGYGVESTCELPPNHQYYVPPGGSAVTATASASATTVNGINSAIITAVPVAPAMGTLCNIGNTCYLNSVVYTLRFAPHFLHNLHHLIHDVNVVQQSILRQQNAKTASLGRSWSTKDLVEPYNISTSGNSNPNSNYSNNNNANGSSSGSNNGTSKDSNTSSKSSHQSVSEKLHELYNSLHTNEMADSSEPYHADTLLHAIQDVNATFEGNQQQDAHEFLMCVLNCIRETNQSLIKAIGECPEVIANGYIANPDETDTVDALERSDVGNQGLLGVSGNGAVGTSQTQSNTAATITKKTFFGRKSKRKDDEKSSKATRVQSPLKDNSPTATSGGIQPVHAASNSLFYLNTVDLTGASSAVASTPPAAASASASTKYSSDDEMNTASLLKNKMRLEERIRQLNLNFFNTDFEGIVVLTTKCLSCETITRQKQGMLDISVPVPISGYDNAELQEKPSAYIQNSCITREYFRGDNKYSCNQCTGYTEAIRSISYEVLPRLLVIQLNRFSGGMEKVSTYVPTTFTLPCFCAKCCELSDANKLHVYKLYSVITHVGATLTVGHYIAYTCFLDLASDYINCPKDRRNNTQAQPPQQQQQQQQQAGNENTAPSNISSASAAASALASSGTSLMKKMKFGRSKASSSGDMSKNVKQLNGFTSKTITNGIGKLSMNTTCHGVNCCAMRLCCSSNSNSGGGSGAGSASASSSDFSEESLQNGSNSNLSNTVYPTGYGSTGRGGVKANYNPNSSEPIWYMCDDDKIKAMTQREFEELLSPTRKITITPYLLFYARFDLQPAQATPSKPNTSSASTTMTTPPPPAPQSSWSNDNLQSGLHKI